MTLLDIFSFFVLLLCLVAAILVSLGMFFSSYQILKCYGVFMLVVTIGLAIASFELFNDKRVDWKIDSIEECYMSEDVLENNDISEYEFLDKLNSETGRKIIKDAIDNDDISIEDGEVYIGDQELLEVLGLD